MKAIVRSCATRLLFALCCAWPFPSQGRTTPRLEPLPVEVALSERSLGLYSAVRLSHDGLRVAYTVCEPRRVPSEVDAQGRSRTGVVRFGLGCDVWVADTASGNSKNLTGAAGSNWAPSWSPDGSLLAFYSDRSGLAALWVWSAASGQLRRLSDVLVRPWGGSSIAWTPDGRALVVPVLAEGMTVDPKSNPEGARKEPSSEEGRTTVTLFEFRPSSAGKGQPPGAWSSELLRADLAVVDAGTGSLRRLVSGQKPAGFWMSPDGSRVAFTVHRGFEAAQSQQQLFDLKVVAVTGGPDRTLVERVPQEFGVGAAWSPDGKAIAYLTSPGECFLVPAAGGQPRRVTEVEHPKFEEDDSTVPIFSSRGDALYLAAGNALWRLGRTDGSGKEFAKVEGREFQGLVRGRRRDAVVLVTRDDETKKEGLAEVDLATGAVTRLWEAARSIGRDPAFRVAAGAGRIVFAQQDAAEPEDLWVLSSGEAAPRRLTQTNPAFAEFVMGETRLVDWLNADGKKLKGAVLLPAGYSEGKRYPLVVFVYGGGHLSNSIHSFGMRGAWGPDDNFQLLATRGYAVFLPDAPSDWKDQMRDLPKNVLPGVNRVIELGIADPERLGIMGHSNGGYSTLALITQTTRFQAAVMRAGMGNFFGFFGELGKDGSHYGLGVAESAFGMGNPWDSRSRYLENSPVLYLDRVKTPLLIVHGSNDTAVAVFLAEEVFVDLRRLGKEVVLARYDGEGHSLESYPNQVDYVNRMLAWFDEHLKKDPVVP
jgi:dipeptidyl aminopeptidase/acylaminoacyl peptidase